MTVKYHTIYCVIDTEEQTFKPKTTAHGAKVAWLQQPTAYKYFEELEQKDPGRHRLVPVTVDYAMQIQLYFTTYLVNGTVVFWFYNPATGKWDDKKRTLQESIADYPVHKYQWIPISLED